MFYLIKSQSYLIYIYIINKKNFLKKKKDILIIIINFYYVIMLNLSFVYINY